MFKKIIIGIIAAAVLASPFTGIALAAEDHPEGIRVRGEVTSVNLNAGNFMIETREGEVLTFFANQDTQFRGKAQNLDELEIGWKVGVGGREGEDGKLWAVLIISGDPEDFIQARGRVSNINNSAGKFTIEKPDGDKMTFFVDEDTRYSGQISSLEDLQEGWQAGVVAKEDNPGKLLAVSIVAEAPPELHKAAGTVTSVDPNRGQFEIETDEGRSLSIIVDEKTRYQGQLSSLEELQVGWKAGVTAKETEDGKLLAVLVNAGTRPELVRAQGIILGVDAAAGKFRLEKQDGSILTFLVDEETKYQGQVEGIRDLEEGMRASVGGYESQSGDLIARQVMAGNPQDERPELLRAQGTIKSVNPGAGKFQLEKPDGSILIVYVDGKTRFSGQANSFDDLEKGMRAGFGGYIDENGKVIARVVAAGSPRPERPERPEGERPEGQRPEGLRPGGERPDPSAGGPEFLSQEPTL